MAKLSSYLKERNLTVEQFGALIERSGATVSRIARGIQKPDSETMQRIIDATGGAVQPNDFFKLPESAATDTAA